MKVIIAGGGTGGHVFPAISIAEEILKRSTENEVLFVGTEKGLERELLVKRGYQLKLISSGGIVGKGLLRSLGGVVSAIKGVFDSFRIIKGFSPDFVIGVGGYASGPLVLTAALLSLPTAICEQNSIPGITNRILGRFVKRVFATFEESLSFFPKTKALVTGNPIRSGLMTHREKETVRSGFTVLVFGGSQGAHTLNLSVPKAFGILGRRDVSIIHQTGSKDVQEVSEVYQCHGVWADVLPFIEDMAAAYKQADFVIGRAGAGTIAEITALGIASILVPYPHSTHNHQLENARAVERAGAAVVIEDRNATPERIAEVLTILLKEDKINYMSGRAKSLGKPDAAKRVVDEMYRLMAGD